MIEPPYVYPDRARRLKPLQWVIFKPNFRPSSACGLDNKKTVARLGVVAQRSFKCATTQWLAGVLAAVFSVASMAQSGASPDVPADAEVANNYYRYSNARLEAICAKMSSRSYASGLTEGAWTALPGAGKTYFYKSSCYLELARRTGDLAFCQSVRERKTLTGDGAAVSPKACEAIVNAVRLAEVKQAESDRLRAASLQGMFKMSPVRVLAQADGNWLVTVQLTGTLPGRYLVQLESARGRAVLQRDTLQLDNNQTLSWSVQRSTLVKDVPLPAIFPMAVSLTYMPEKNGGGVRLEQLSGIQNFTLSVQ